MLQWTAEHQEQLHTLETCRMMSNKDGQLAGQGDCTEDVGLREREGGGGGREREREREREANE